MQKARIMTSHTDLIENINIIHPAISIVKAELFPTPELAPLTVGMVAGVKIIPASNSRAGYIPGYLADVRNLVIVQGRVCV